MELGGAKFILFFSPPPQKKKKELKIMNEVNKPHPHCSITWPDSIGMCKPHSLSLPYGKPTLKTKACKRAATERREFTSTFEN
jgi:hypothetical protein